MAHAAPCPERLELGTILADAISKSYTLRREYEAAKAAGSSEEKIAAAATALQQAQDALTTADRRFREHVEQHGCSAVSRVPSPG